MSEAGSITNNESDEVIHRSNHFHDNSFTADSETSKGFSVDTGKVETFHLDWLANRVDLKELWKVV